MDQAKIKSQLEALLGEAKDASTKEQIENILSELENTVGNSQLSDPSKIPKPVLKKGADYIARFFLKFVEHKVIKQIWEEIGEIDIGDIDLDL